MNLKDIVDLCKSGQAADAYAESQKQLAANPDDRYARVGAAYSIKALMEQYVSSGDDAAALCLLDEYAALRLEEVEEAEMNNRLIWAVRSLILSWKDKVDFAKADALSEAVRNVAFLKPHRYYSVLLDTFLKLKDARGNAWPGIPSFVTWWGLENLLPEDFNRVLLTNGQSMPSLAERVYTATLKALAAEVVNGRLLDEAEAFLGDLEVLEETHPEYTNILYRKAHLLKAMGRTDEALACARFCAQASQRVLGVVGSRRCRRVRGDACCLLLPLAELQDGSGLPGQGSLQARRVDAESRRTRIRPPRI